MQHPGILWLMPVSGSDFELILYFLLTILKGGDTYFFVSSSVDGFHYLMGHNGH